ncbi:YdcF family protein [Xenophilus sp.]|uniref:YdcF family protein n=1 Tax=Xenophilus sp. TaxID=1873499 RepID=UPI0037DC4EA4
MKPRRAAALLLALGLAGWGGTALVVARHGEAALRHPPERPADAALVLGNRAWLDGAPNPCLASRVEAAVALARGGLVRQLVMSGGEDSEDGRIEADEMEGVARTAGYAGAVLRERASQSTRENLRLAWPLLVDAGVRSVIVVTEPGHLWRTERLARASGFERAFDVQYAATPVACRRSAWRAVQAVLREPLAIVHNALHGHL